MSQIIQRPSCLHLFLLYNGIFTLIEFICAACHVTIIYNILYNFAIFSRYSLTYKSIVFSSILSIKTKNENLIIFNKI